MFRYFVVILAATTLALSGCSDATRPEDGRLDPDTTQGPGTTPPPPPDTTGIQQRRLIECPIDQAVASSSLLSPLLGGTVSAAGSSIALLPGSFLTATLITFTVPASPYMEVDITANGLPTFVFLKPATVTLDYSRCPASVTQGKTLTVWHINTQTKALIGNMNGVNDPVARRMTFTTNHLSGYAIAQ